MIQPPAYKKNAVPSPRGWRHPRTGELLKKTKLSEKEINEYLLAQGTISAPEIEVVDVFEDKTPYVLDSMSKNQLIATAEEWGIEVDPKATKAVIKAKLDEEVV